MVAHNIRRQKYFRLVLSIILVATSMLIFVGASSGSSGTKPQGTSLQNNQPTPSTQLAQRVRAVNDACAQATTKPLPPNIRTLHIGISGLVPNTFLATSTTPATRIVAAAVHRGLTAEDEHGNIVPMLAESVPTLENGGALLVQNRYARQQQLVVTFRLREHLRWSDGQPLTTEDVKFTYKFLQQSNMYDAQVAPIERIDAPDSQTITVTYKPELQPFHYNHPLEGLLYPEHVLKGLTPTDVEAGLCALRPITAGPYIVRDWRYVGEPRIPLLPGVATMSQEEAGPTLQRLTLEANPYYMHGQPNISRIIIDVIPDKHILLERLRQGQLDLVADGAIETVNPDVQQAMDAGFVLEQAFEQRWERLGFNLLQGATSEEAVRQAITYAINRQAIVNRVFGERGRVMQSWIPESSWAYSPVLATYQYDPTRARALLAQAGYKPDAQGVAMRDGKRLHLVFRFPREGDLRQQVATMIQQDLTNIGIEVDMRPASRGAVLGAFGYLEQHNFDIVMFGWYGRSDPDGFTLWHSSQIPNADNDWRGQNYVGWRNNENDALLEHLNAPVARSAQVAMYHQQQQLFAEMLPELPLFEYPKFAFYTPSLKGIKLPIGMIPSTWNVEEWDVQ